MISRTLRVFGLLALVIMLGASALSAADYYVSAKRGKGKKATREKPAKDLGNIASKLKAGDTVHIAEGVYLGRGESGADEINVPVKIIGGYSDDFSKRDPWGAHKTILSGLNKSKNWKPDARLRINLQKYREANPPDIVVDGIIVDNAPRNHYQSDQKRVIVRSASPKTGRMPTPESGGIVIAAAKDNNVAVRNCVVINTAPTQGVLQVSGNKNSKVTIENNLVLNNTGSGIYAGTLFAGADAEAPSFTIRNNTSVFNWKHDPIASYGGNGLKLDPGVKVEATNNVLAYNDFYGVHNAKNAKNVLLKDNLFYGNVAADYLEFNTRMDADVLVDEAESLHEDSDNNLAAKIKLPLGQGFLALFFGRPMIDRNALEADVKAQNTRANAVRSLFGLPVWGGKIKGPEISSWLPAVALDDALQAGRKFAFEGVTAGCAKP